MLIKPKTRKGQNKINEGLGNNVVVIQKNHPSNPPAVLVAPSNEPTMKSRFIRWIKLTDDQDFEIINN